MKEKDRLETVAKTKASAMGKKAAGEESQSGEMARVTAAELRGIIDDWPAAPKKVAEEYAERYGPPNEATPTLLIWRNNGPWKRTEISKDETVHNFPTPHTDYITNYIAYQVPLEKYIELGQFDGSVIPYRTRGEVSARCDNEAANFLSMNLMHDIVQGRRTVDDARKEFAEQTAAWVMNRPAPYTQTLHFQPATAEETGDPDEAVMKKATANQTLEKVKDVLGFGESDADRHSR